jgi:hypothetical protein
MKLKSATPKTNAGYTQCAGSGPCFFDDDGPIAGDMRVAKNAGAGVADS